MSPISETASNYIIRVIEEGLEEYLTEQVKLEEIPLTGEDIPER